MIRLRYFLAALSFVTLMLSSLMWMSLPANKDEEYFERYTKEDLEQPKQSDTLNAYFLDLDRGEATLFVTPTQQTILVDTGNLESFKKLSFILNELNISEIDHVFLTTNQVDYLGGLTSLLEEFKIKHLYLPKAESFDSLARTFQEHLMHADHVAMLAENNRLIIEDGIEVLSLHSMPLVLSLRHQQISYLLMSEANFETEEYLLKQYGDRLHAQILKVGNHGQSFTNSDEFLKAVNPQVAIIMGGESDEHSRISNGVIERLLESWIDVYRTDTLGTITITSDGVDYEVKTDLSTNSQ